MDKGHDCYRWQPFDAEKKILELQTRLKKVEDIIDANYLLPC